MKKNYLIPCLERFTKVNNGTTTSVMVVDDCGVLVDHVKGEVPSDDTIRRHLIGVREVKILVQADNVFEALMILSKMDGANVGTKRKALDTNYSKTNPINEYVGCEFMKRDKGYATCSELDDEHTEEDYSMFCILSGLSEPHTSCKILREKEDKEKVLEERLGIWVQCYK